MKSLLAGVAGLLLPLTTLAAEPAPAPTITLNERTATVTPHRTGFQHTGAGNIDVAQPAPDTVVITMTGVAVAGPHPLKESAAALDFALAQAFEIGMDKAEGKKIKLTVDARVIGLLRSEVKGQGTAEASGAVTVGGPGEGLTLAVPSHGVCAGESLSINDHAAPASAVVATGKYSLNQTFHVGVSHPRGLCGKAWSAEFAPDPALDPLWISYFEPFHGANKKDFGFQVTIKVTAE